MPIVWNAEKGWHESDEVFKPRLVTENGRTRFQLVKQENTNEETQEKEEGA